MTTAGPEVVSASTFPKELVAPPTEAGGVDLDRHFVVTSSATEAQLVSHLREELRQKEDYIRRQAAELHRLQNLLRSLPPQAIYGVMQQQQTRMPGSGVG